MPEKNNPVSIMLAEKKKAMEGPHKPPIQTPSASPAPAGEGLAERMRRIAGKK